MATPARQPDFSLGGYLGQPGALAGIAFWPRAGARVIDLVVHYCIYFGSAIFFGVMLGIIAAVNQTPIETLTRKMEGVHPAAFLLALLGSVAYHTICEAGSGVTLGKLAIGAVVVQEDGTPCRFGAAVARSFAYFVDGLFFGIIGYMRMQKTPQMQRYGDAWAHTVVVKREQAKQPPGGGRVFGMLVVACLADAACAVLGFALMLV